jgi:hypothetical protein
MKTLGREEANILFDKYWDEMSHVWFKVEVLQDYAGEDDGPSLQSWIKGDKQTSIAFMKEDASPEWVQSCQEKLRNDVKLIRLHLVEEPYSPYLEWELEYYKNVNIPKCGEQVFLVKKSAVSNLQIPKGDMMIFDDQIVVVNGYNDGGRMISQNFYDQTDNISSFLNLKQQLLRLAKPL